MDDETNWQRQVLVGLVVLVAVGALIGGIVALVSIKAADLAGIDDTPVTTGPFEPGQPRGTDQPPSNSPSEPSESNPPTGPSSGPATTDRSTAPPPETGITLNAGPASVSTYERINLTGTYEAPPGTVLQVQRKEGGVWVDFPTTLTVNGGTFATYVETGHTGLNLFRVLAIGRAETSNTVRVQVG